MLDERLVDELVTRITGTVAIAPRPLALTITQACDALSVSWDFWSEHVAPEVRIVRRGRRRIVPVAELERWLTENAENGHELLGTGKATLTTPKPPARRRVRATRAPRRDGTP